MGQLISLINEMESIKEIITALNEYFKDNNLQTDLVIYSTVFSITHCRIVCWNEDNRLNNLGHVHVYVFPNNNQNIMVCNAEQSWCIDLEDPESLPKILETINCFLRPKPKIITYIIDLMRRLVLTKKPYLQQDENHNTGEHLWTGLKQNHNL